MSVIRHALILLVALLSGAASARDLWLVEQGRLVRVDTISADVRVASTAETVRAVAPTADGGAWILGARTLVRVDDVLGERASAELRADEIDGAGLMATDPHSGTLWMAVGSRLLHIDADGKRILDLALAEPVRALAVAGPDAVFVATASSLARYDGTGAAIARLDLSQLPGGEISGMAIDPLAGLLWLSRAGSLVQFDTLAGLYARSSIAVAVLDAMSVDIATGELTMLAGREIVRLDRDGKPVGGGVFLRERLDSVAGIEPEPSGTWLWFGDLRGFGVVDLRDGSVIRIPLSQSVTRFEPAPPQFESYVDAEATGSGMGTDVSLRYVAMCDGSTCTPTSAFLRALKLDVWLGQADVTALFGGARGDTFIANVLVPPWQVGPPLAASTVDAYGNRSLAGTVTWPIVENANVPGLFPKAGSPPAVTITAPLNNATFTAPASTTIKATATPSTGATITKIDFFAGATLLGTVSVSPYNFTWSNVQVGTYVLTAKVTDSTAATATSTAITVTVTAGTMAKPIDAWLFNDAWTSATPIADAAGVHEGAPTGTLAAVTSVANAPKPNTCKAANFTGGAIDVAGLVLSTAAGVKTTVSFWMYWDGTDIVMPIGWVTQGLILSGGSFGFTTQNGDVFGIAATGFTNKWQHVIAEFANGSVASNKLYLNGVPQALTQRAGTPLVTNAVVAPTLRIGGLTGNTGFRFKGQLDEVKLFNRALTAVEASAEFAAANACDTAPTVALTAPVNNANFVAPASIVLTAIAAATSATATLTKVEFYSGATLLATKTASPFTYTWASVAVGSYRLTAKATDSKGSTATSTVVTVNVKANVAPLVSMTSPANNSVFTAPATINLAANASDSDGTVTKVEFYQGATRLATITTPPYTYTWSSVAGATYSLTAKATDDRGAVTTSSVVSVIVNKPPTVSITAPANNANIIVGSTITISANASDPDGSIAKVEFYRDGVLVATDTTSPYSYVWSNVALGTYVLTVKATDNRGVVTTSNPVTITVKNNQAPTVTITSPVNGAKVPQLSPFTITATATDPDGSVARVEFYRDMAGNSLLQGNDTTYPYSIAVQPFVDSGPYTLTAWAFDNRGAVTFSAPVTVVQNQLPTVVFTQPQDFEVVSPNALPNVVFAVSASDPDGSITSVRFWKRSDQTDGGTDKGGDAAPVLLGTLTAPPYQVTWSNIPYTDPTGAGIGLHMVWAEAIDDTGEVQSTGETPFLVWKNAPPSNTKLKITTPDPNAYVRTFQAPASIVLVGSGVANASVEWFANGVSIGTTSAPNGANGEYAFIWRNVSAGAYTITAGLFVGSGGVGNISDPLTITVGDVAQPTVTIQTPTSGAVVPRDQSQPITASVTNFTTSQWNYIEFTDNYRYLTYDYTAPYDATYAPAPGIHALQAQAFYGGVPVGEPSRRYVIAPVVARPPVGVITSPSPSGSYASNTSIALTVDATALDGTISRVDFYNGAGVFASRTTPPYTVAAFFPSGVSSVYAVVNTLFGPRSYTTPVTFTVAGPTNGVAIALTSPAGGQKVVSGANLPLTVNVTDPQHKVTQVTYTWTANVNGGQVAASSAPPYSASWAPSTPGDYILVATAVTSSGGDVASAPIYFTVVPNYPPVVSLTSPTPGQAFYVGQPIPLTAAASDPDGSVAKVEYFTSTGTLIGSATSPPFNASWTIATPGSYALYAKATDNAGSSTQTSPISITVNANAVPIVSLTSPQSGSSFAVGATINLAATASDSDGSVARVEFYAGSTLLGSATAAPYLFAWSNIAAGSYSLTARAVDNRGGVTISAAANVQVQPLVLNVTSPADGASIASDFVLVKGTIQAPPNSGVTINGLVADSDGTNFFINNFSLAAGANVITIKLTTSDGRSISQTRTVTSTAASPYQLAVDAESILAPASTLLRVERGPNQKIVSLQVSNLGGGTADTSVFDGETLAKLTFATPGRYEPTFTIQDDLGNSYSQSIAIMVLDPAALGAVLKAVWTGLAGSLSGGDKAGAMNRISEHAQPIYDSTFDALAPHMMQIVATWSAPVTGVLSSDVAEFVVSRFVQGKNRAFFIYLMRERDGVWRVTSM